MLITAAIGGLFLFTAPAAATPETEPVTKSCEAEGVDCGEWPEEVPAETECKIKIDGGWLEGEVNDQGQCVCEYEPVPTTSTTVPETTTTTEAPTTTSTVPVITVPQPTTTVASPSTTVVSPTTLAPTTTTVSDANLFETCDEAEAAGHTPLYPGDVGYRLELDSDGDGVACENSEPSFVARPATSRGELPRTGLTTDVLAAAGFGLLGMGLALVAAKRRFAR